MTLKVVFSNLPVIVIEKVELHLVNKELINHYMRLIFNMETEDLAFLV